MNWLCGECGISTEQLRCETTSQIVSDMVLMAQHAREAHDVSEDDLGYVRQVGDAYLFFDGRIFMRQAKN